MAQGDSNISICNIALIALGEEPIITMADATKRAILCNARYDDIRRFVIRTHTWNCCKKQAQIAADPTAPLFQYTYRYRIPTDFIRFYDEDQSMYDMSVWDVMDGFIYSNDTAPLNITYIFDQQDCTLMDAIMTHVIAYNIASELGMSITQNATKVQNAKDFMKAKYDIARFIGAQENAPREWDVDVLLRSRNR